MHKFSTFLYILLIALLSFSCKNENRETQKSEVENKVTELNQKPVKRAAKKELTQDDIEMLKSVMSRIMRDPELKRFASYTVSAGLADQLSKEGTVTVFAPSNAALGVLNSEKKKRYANPENQLELQEMLKSHIVEGNWDKETLLKNIDKNGRAKLKTLAGNTLTLSKSGEDIIISTGKNGSATVINNSTEASNGVVYLVDGVLSVN